MCLCVRVCITGWMVGAEWTRDRDREGEGLEGRRAEEEDAELKRERGGWGRGRR